MYSGDITSFLTFRYPLKQSVPMWENYGIIEISICWRIPKLDDGISRNSEFVNRSADFGSRALELPKHNSQQSHTIPPPYTTPLC